MSSLTKTLTWVGKAIALAAIAGSSVGCYRKDPLYCETNADCADVPGRPFCDFDGEFPSSNGVRKTCIASPFDAGVPADADLRPDGPPDTAALVISPETWSYGAIDRGQTGDAKTFIVENRGGVESGPVLVNVTGGDASSFAVLSGETTDCAGQKVGSGTSCFVRLQFDPQGAAGPKSATLDVQASPGGDVTSSVDGAVHDCQPSTTLCVPATGNVVTCDGNGAITQTQQCGALGCDQSMNVCLDVDPSNGLAGALDTTSTAGALTSTTPVSIDTDAGTIRDVNNDVLATSTMTVSQAAGLPAIRVFAFSSVSLGDVSVSGTQALAIVSNGSVALTGYFAATGSRSPLKPGPGALSTTACVGTSSTSGGSAGGGGRETAGGSGGSSGQAGGQSYRTRTGEPLVGGCRGGDVVSGGVTKATGGYGGGAVQIVSRVSITMTGNAKIDVGAEGGSGGPSSTYGGAGGGSAGVVLLEAPTIEVNGAGVVLAASGGAGGEGGSIGADGTNGEDGGTGATAPGQACLHDGCGGLGGFAQWDGVGTPIIDPTTELVGRDATGAGGGGGGGSTGYVYLRTKSGTIQLQSGAAIRAYGGVGTLRTRPRT